MNYYITTPSPLGELIITSNGNEITGLYTPGNSHYEAAQNGIEDETPFEEAIRQLDEYFAGQRQEFDLPLAIEGTEFQKNVWKTLQSIPHGKTRSYVELAAAIGDTNASRAVGTANGRNPISIIIPCHRVINASGELGGYNGGLDKKKWLLDHEAKKAG